MKHSVADRVSQQFSEFMSNRPHHHTLFCGLTRFCPHCCCSSINSSDSVLPLDGPKVEILFLKTFQLINVCTYVYYIYPIDVDLQERLLDSIVMLAVSEMGTLSNSLPMQLLTCIIKHLLPYFPSPLLKTLGITQIKVMHYPKLEDNGFLHNGIPTNNPTFEPHHLT